MSNYCTLKPAEVAIAIVELGIAKHRTRADELFSKAVLAGVILSFSGSLSLLAGGGLTALNPGLVKLISSFIFPVGLVMVVLQGQELLTSNMIVFPIAVIKRAVPWWSLLINWSIVFFGNVVGSLFSAAILVKYSGIFSVEPYLSLARSLATHRVVAPEWHQIFIRGIGCNFLVCIAVWQAVGTRTIFSKIFGIWLPIWIFVASGYDHVVADMFEIHIGILLGAPAPLTAGYYIWKSLIPAFLGNVVGALFVALPATYYLLNDYAPTEKLRSAEEGGDDSSCTKKC